jgi:hypothetical protein
MPDSSPPHAAGKQPQVSHEQPAQPKRAEASPEFEAALESECVALLALEASRARVRFLPGDFGAVDADLGGAIDLLRHAIADLRARVIGSPPSLLALGFVVRQEDLGRPG